MGEGEQRQRGRDEENQYCALEHSIAVKGRERGGRFEYFMYLNRSSWLGRGPCGQVNHLSRCEFGKSKRR